MKPRNNTDQFDAFRRERTRAKTSPSNFVPGYENSALQQLERAEQLEVQDQKLTREVQDFFAVATQQAAAIVKRVSHDAEAQAGERMQGEVEGFLNDTLSRMNNFIMTVMQQRQSTEVAETHVEPDVKHLVGSELDEFRYNGTPEARDAHIGKNPFATPLEQVQSELRAVVAEMDREDCEVAPISGNFPAATAEVDDLSIGDPQATLDTNVTDETRPHDSNLTSQEVAAVTTTETHACHETHSEQIDDSPPPTLEEELEQFKSALRALVRQGVMQREEARAAWNTRLSALGSGL